MGSDSLIFWLFFVTLAVGIAFGAIQYARAQRKRGEHPGPVRRSAATTRETRP
jgi:hypothetical protein